MELLQVNQLIESTEIFVKERLAGTSGDGHDYEHTQRVVRHALDLCSQMPHARQEIVHLAALLHDVARIEESASNGAIDHASRGAEIAREFLERQGAAPEMIGRIIRCVQQHRYRSDCKPDSVEAEILYDADKLDSLGAVGIGRAFLFAGAVGAKLHNSAAEAVNSPAYSREDTAYREYLVKLSKLPEKMLTPCARIRAEQLKNFMDSFFEQLNKEFFG